MSIQSGSSMPKEGTADLPHFVSDAVFDLKSVEKLTPEQEKIYFASFMTQSIAKKKKQKFENFIRFNVYIKYGSHFFLPTLGIVTTCSICFLQQRYCYL